MPSLRDYIDLLGHKPGYRLKIGGRQVYDVIMVERDASFDQFAASLKITVANEYLFTPDSINTVVLEEGYNGYYAVTFTGYVDDCIVGRFPNTWEIQCRDVLKKAVDTWLDDEGVEYNMTQADAAVSDLLGRAGLTALDIGSTNFTIGDVNPAKFKLVSIMDAVLQIAALIGWHVWATSDGVVHFHYKKPLPGTSVFWDYQTQDNILGYRYTKTDRNLRNKIVVVGYDDIRAEASAPSPYVANPPTYRTAILSSELIDTQQMAQVIANWMLGDLNHLTESVEMDIQANPLLNVGHTITIDLVEDGYSAEYFIFSLRATNNGDSGEFMMHLVCVGGKSSPIDYVPPGSDDDPGTDPGTGQYPTPSFSFVVGVFGDPSYIVYFNASASFSPGAAIVSYAWDWGDGSSDLFSVPFATHRYAAVGAYTVTLTVTDANGLYASVSQLVHAGDQSSGQLAQRVLYMAGGGRIYGSPDGGQKWYFTDLPVPQAASSLAASKNTDPDDELDTGVALTSSNNHLYGIYGYGQSNAVIYTFSDEATASIVDVAIDPNDADHWVVVFDNGHVHESEDAGVTWAQILDLENATAKYAWVSPLDPQDWMIPGNAQVVRDGINLAANWEDLAAADVNGLWWSSELAEIGITQSDRVGLSPDNGISWVTPTGISGTITCIGGNWIVPGAFVVGASGKDRLFYTYDAGSFYDTAAFSTIYGIMYSSFDVTYDPDLYNSVWVVG